MTNIFQGFRGCCLKACAEVSSWTRFCEIHMMQSTANFLRDSRSDRLVDITLISLNIFEIICDIYIYIFIYI